MPASRPVSVILVVVVRREGSGGKELFEGISLSSLQLPKCPLEDQRSLGCSCLPCKMGWGGWVSSVVLNGGQLFPSPKEHLAMIFGCHDWRDGTAGI